MGETTALRPEAPSDTERAIALKATMLAESYEPPSITHWYFRTATAVALGVYLGFMAIALTRTAIEILTEQSAKHADNPIMSGEPE